MADDNGSATHIGTGDADAGIPTGDGNGTGGQGSNTGSENPFSGLQDAGIREWVEKQGLKDVESLAKKARDAESLIGQSIRLPGDNATAEDWSKVYAKLGRPEKADGYQFTLPENAPEDFPVDADFQSGLAGAAHELGLSAKQAAGIHDFFVGSASKVFEANNEATVAEATKATETLEMAFGGKKGSEPFKMAVGRIGHLLKDQGGKVSEALQKHGVEADIMAGLKEAGVISEEGAVLNAPVAIMLHQLSTALYSEDDLVTGDGVGSAGNPFKGGPGTGNQTEQMKLIREDRDKAIRLMRQAGHDPKGWGLAA